MFTHFALLRPKFQWTKKSKAQPKGKGYYKETASQAKTTIKKRWTDLLFLLFVDNGTDIA